MTKVRLVGLITVTAPAATLFEPMVTEVAAGTKPVPVTVTVVPPAVGPETGVKLLAVGSAT